MSQSSDASTARLDPSLTAITSSTPRRISTIVWVTGPPSKTRAAPCVRLVKPEVTAASWSARPREASWMAAALPGAARCYEARGQEAKGQEARCSEAPGHGGRGHQGPG